MSENLQLELLISGIVQGVGFRATVYRLACQLGLRGTVRNCVDGGVEVIAQGPEENLKALAQKLQQGPGRVDSVDARWSSPVTSFTEFEIL